MNSQKLPFIAIILGLIGLAFWSSIFIVDERQQANVLRFGKIVQTQTEPGLYFKRPIMDQVQYIEDRLITLELNDLNLEVNDGRRYIVDAFLTYKIDDPVVFRQTVAGQLSIAQNRLSARFDTTIRDVYGEADFNDALSEKRSVMMATVLEQLKESGESIGVEVIDVRVKRTDLSQDVSTQVFERMKAERLQEAARLRAIGEQQSIRIRAEADREVVVTVAQANQQAEILRGDGDAERNRIFAEAFKKDPEFFEFYRSMQAYQKAISEDNTTLVLSPNSEFFKYFNQSKD